MQQSYDLLIFNIFIENGTKVFYNKTDTAGEVYFVSHTEGSKL